MTFNWIPVPLPSPSSPSLQGYFQLEITNDPNNSQHLYVATSRGLLSSTDGGLTWSFIGPDVYVPGIEPSASNSQVIYDIEIPFAAIGAGLYRSNDGGLTFSPANSGLPPFSNGQQYNTFAVDPNHPNIIYVPVFYTDSLVSGSLAQLWRSVDSGQTWTQLPQPLGSLQTESIVVDPSNSSHLLFGTDLGLLNSFDGGSTWTRASSLPANAIFDLVYDHGIVFAATNGGGYRSLDNGNTWTRIQGADGNQIGSIVIDPNHPNIIFANSITSSDIYISVDMGLSWNSLGQIPGFGGARSIAYDSVHNTLFALGDALYELTPSGTFNSGTAIDLARSQFNGSISELVNTTNSNTVDKASGAIFFADPDLGDRPAVSVGFVFATWLDAQGHFVLPPVQQLQTWITGTFSIGTKPGSTNSGEFDWSYALQDSAFDILGAGEKLSITAALTISDGHGYSVIQNVGITIVGQNDAPVAVPDFATVSKGGQITGNVLANDTDPDLHDQGTLHVDAVNGTSIGVGMSIQGSYGVLTIAADGAYTYNQTLKFPQNSSAADIFAYTVGDGHPGGITTSVLSINVLNQQASSGPGGTGSIIDIAKSFIGTTWGNENCTGFVFTVSAETNSPFYDLSSDALSHQKAYGGDSTLKHLLNDSNDSTNSFLFAEPISDIKATSSSGVPAGGKALPFGYTSWVFTPTGLDKVASSSTFVFENSDLNSDHWHLVGAGGANGSNVTTLNLDDPVSIKAGEIFRGVVIENGQGANGNYLISHAGIVASYDSTHHDVTLIDNWPLHDGATTLPKVDKIGMTTFHIGSPDGGHPGILPGYFALYELG
jgi:VCBS repeat-containing protein